MSNMVSIGSAEIGGTMPEKLETPENISKVKSRIKKEEKKLLE